MDHVGMAFYNPLAPLRRQGVAQKRGTTHETRKEGENQARNGLLACHES